MKATEQYFPVVLFIMLYKVALVFEWMEKLTHFNKSCKEALSCGAVYFAEKCCSDLRDCNKIF